MPPAAGSMASGLPVLSSLNYLPVLAERFARVSSTRPLTIDKSYCSVTYQFSPTIVQRCVLDCRAAHKFAYANG